MSETTENKSGNCEVCQQSTQRKCIGCKLVYYCCPDHQKEHWRVHREKCRPFEINQSTELGRYLKATRNLEAGDIIFTELPLVFGPKQHIIDEGPFPCVGCCRLIEQENCVKCPECLWPACSLQCGGLKDNFYHGLECRVLKLRQSSTESFYKSFRFDILVILRVLLLQKTNKAKWDQLIRLEDHLDKRGPGTEVFKIIDEKVKYLEENYLKPLKTLEKETGKTLFTEVSSDIIHKIYAILDVNAIELTDDIDAQILYATASLIEHNCTPNTVQNIEDNKQNYRITFRAALPIQKDDHFTSICTHILWGTHARRQHLKQTKYFSCNCRRCQDPTELGSYLSALRCLGTENEPCGGTQLPNNPTEDKVRWVCDKCKIRLPNNEIMKFVDHLGSEVDKVVSKQPTITELEELLGKLMNFLHPNHYHAYTVKHSLIQLYNSKTIGVELADGLLDEKIKMCQDLIGITKKIDPGNSRLSMYLGVLLHEFFDARFARLNRSYTRDKADEFVDEIRDINEIIKENRRVLQYDIKSPSGGKLYQVVCQNGIKFQKWLTDNNQTGLI